METGDVGLHYLIIGVEQQFQRPYYHVHGYGAVEAVCLIRHHPYAIYVAGDV